MCACGDAFAIVLGEAGPPLQKDSGNIAFHLLVSRSHSDHFRLFTLFAC
jgi:hypothetical protein